MRTLIFALTLLLVTTTNIQSQTEYKIVNVKSNEQKQYLSSEFGIVIGTPATFNLNYAKHFDDFLVKISGLYLGNYQGGQLDLGYKFAHSRRTYHAVTIGGGLARFPRETEIYRVPLSDRKWNYGSISYLMNTKGFLMSVGLSAGEGDFPNPQLIFQIGYSSQFWK
ncbi:MAG: hypothetical protein WC121_12705 [Candidatus Kapaibacterium sp.]